ncbi:MAG: hypothetical protein JST12_20045 [Armatimonadetes bacterium]|nr:hypothetical protein [Armatimonadota bacterium]MBS1727983.1 hypothetical protein [Armatimonadota bacterium]
MNREKKQALVLAVLFVLILGVGAFRMMGGSQAAPAAAKKKTDDKATENKDSEKPVIKNPEFKPLASRDPFMPAPFMTAGADQPTTPVPTPTPRSTPKADTERTAPLPMPFSDDHTGFKAGGIAPLPVPQDVKPVFNYSVVGLIEGAHPAAVFEDAQGNQQMVEIGQGIGSSATLIDITRGRVRVKFNAETLVLNVGGNPPHAK